MKKIKIITLFPDIFEEFLNHSIIKRAIDQNLLSVEIINLRNYSLSKHNQVDDYQAGGGPGMVLMAPVVINAIEDNIEENMIKILISPQGKVWNQKEAYNLAESTMNYLLVCGHYEGFDERIRDYVDCELSIGDYILTGGELPAMVIVDSITRLLDGVIKWESHENDSFTNDLLDHPVYTKPNSFRGKDIPEVLLSGNHQKIKEWRRYKAIENTYQKRPDIINEELLSETDKIMVADIIKNKKERKT